MSKLQSFLSWIGSRVRLSFLSALAGWGAGILYWTLAALSNSVFHPKAQGVINLGSGAIWILVISLGMGTVVLAVCIVAFLPLTLLVPDESVLWKPGILSMIGFSAGPIIVGLGAIYQTMQGRYHSYLKIYDMQAYIISELVPYGIPAAFIGGVTCFVAATLHKRQPPPSRHSPRIL